MYFLPAVHIDRALREPPPSPLETDVSTNTSSKQHSEFFNFNVKSFNSCHCVKLYKQFIRDKPTESNDDNEQ